MSKTVEKELSMTVEEATRILNERTAEYETLTAALRAGQVVDPSDWWEAGRKVDHAQLQVEGAHAIETRKAKEEREARLLALVPEMEGEIPGSIVGLDDAYNRAVDALGALVRHVESFNGCVRKFVRQLPSRPDPERPDLPWQNEARGVIFGDRGAVVLEFWPLIQAAVVDATRDSKTDPDRWAVDARDLSQTAVKGLRKQLVRLTEGSESDAVRK
jgi:hypothetical protein